MNRNAWKPLALAVVGIVGALTSGCGSDEAASTAGPKATATFDSSEELVAQTADEEIIDGWNVREDDPKASDGDGEIYEAEQPIRDRDAPAHEKAAAWQARAERLQEKGASEWPRADRAQRHANYWSDRAQREDR